MFDKWLWLGSISVFNGKISTLLHKNFDFSKNAVRNFNFILRLFQLSLNLLKRNLN